MGTVSGLSPGELRQTSGPIMSYIVTHTSGTMERNLPTSRFGELLDELALTDAEHPDVSVTHESEWCITVGRSGAVILENVEDDDGDPVHAVGLGREEILALLRELAVGNVDKLRSGVWQPGYPPG